MKNTQDLNNSYFNLQNRRYLGNKYKILGFIEDIVREISTSIGTFCDIFAGTGVVGARFNNQSTSVICNDILYSNYVCLKTFLNWQNPINSIIKKIDYLNSVESNDDNYFSLNYGNTYFSIENAKKIGAIREHIDIIAENEDEKEILICSLLYATDKVANTVGHYDAYRKKMDSYQKLKLLIPNVNLKANHNNIVYRKDANALIRSITCNILYIDPPYNSRQYSDAYHLLENLAEWKKPILIGLAKKMDRSHIKSKYCLANANIAFKELINSANCEFILLSYNNTGEKKDVRSNATISDEDILTILEKKGNVGVYEKEYKTFTTGKGISYGNIERIFVCKVR